MSVSDYNYLIIGGTTKGGTTSLFNYLAAHPDISPASFKEIRFFLDLDYPLDSKYRFDGDNLDKYGEYFSQLSRDKLRLEATPDYLYSEGCADRISKSLPRAKIIFILRDPISRLYSWYLFSQQDGNISVKTTFDDYIKLQLKHSNAKTARISQHLRALEQGRYAKYIRPFIEKLGTSNCMIVHLEELERSPVDTMIKICQFSGIDTDFHKSYKFQVANKTQSMRAPKIHGLYKATIHSLRKYTHNHFIVHNFLKKIRQFFDLVYLKINTRADNKIPITDKTHKFLLKYYNNDKIELKRLIKQIESGRGISG